MRLEKLSTAELKALRVNAAPDIAIIFNEFCEVHGIGAAHRRQSVAVQATDLRDALVRYCAEKHPAVVVPNVKVMGFVFRAKFEQTRRRSGRHYLVSGVPDTIPSIPVKRNKRDRRNTRLALVRRRHREMRLGQQGS